MNTPDLFTNVHKGIRSALFSACAALGRAGEDAARTATARQQLLDAMRFVAHHGENEDLLLLPLLQTRIPTSFAQLQAAHGQLDVEIHALQRDAEHAPTAILYARLCAFTALYLQHLHEEESIHEQAIRAVMSFQEIAEFGQKSVARTAPADQRLMLGYMLPVMTRDAVEGFLSKLPPALARELRPLAGGDGESAALS